MTTTDEKRCLCCDQAMPDGAWICSGCGTEQNAAQLGETIGRLRGAIERAVILLEDAAVREIAPHRTAEHGSLARIAAAAERIADALERAYPEQPARIEALPQTLSLRTRDGKDWPNECD